MTSLRLLIVDDEPLIRAGVRDVLRDAEGIEITGECDSCASVMSFLSAQHVDLVLLDVQMPDGTGLDVVERIGPERMPAVIFVTAYDEYAVKAFELNAVDYVLKPFDHDRLQRSVERARQRMIGQHQSNLAEQLQALLDSRARRWPERIVVRDGEHFSLVPVETIDWIESANNYVQLHCGANQHLLAETLSSLEGRLNPARFLRIHRCRIVNLSRVVTVYPILGGAYELELRCGTRLMTGRQYKNTIQRLLRS
ncbi:MAG TPA: LytTR family DNA-binding domain-containing protein [Terracidiphilus sp.]|jgi:two-component system LytT family response regulator